MANVREPDVIKMLMDNQCSTVEALTKISEAQQSTSKSLDNIGEALTKINDSNILHLQLTQDIATQVNSTKDFSIRLLDLIKWVVVASITTMLFILARSNGLDIAQLLPHIF